MSLKHLLVYLGPESGRQPMALAADLARRSAARLRGVHVMREPRQPGPGVVQVQRAPAWTEAPMPGAANSRDSGHDARYEAAKRLRAAFERAVRDAGIGGEFDAQPARDRQVWECLLDEARCCDMTILAKPGGDADEGKVPDHLLRESGGPVLVVPESVEGYPETPHMVIAWNGRREAARAVRDAMPLLEAAGKVSLVMVKPRAETQASAKRLSTMLSAHGIACEEVQERGADLSPGDALISRAEDMGADMLVMGAFGRSRLSEVVSGGGTTRRVLEQTTVPLLMSQ